MATIELDTRVGAPAARVFAAATDVDGWTERIPAITAIERLDDGGPVGVGTRWRETRTVFKREATEEMSITEFDAPRTYTVEGDSCGAHFRTRFDFDEHDGQTTVRMRLESEPQTLFARVMGAVMMPLMRGAMTREMQKDLDALRDSCEREAV